MSLILQCRRAQAQRLSSVWSERPASSPVLVTLLLLAGLAAPAQAAPLTLGAAEAQLARSNPSLAAAAQRIRAIQHRAAAATQLPDPHVSFDAVNLPTNSFSLTQQSMTMLSVGVIESVAPLGLGRGGNQTLALVEAQGVGRGLRQFREFADGQHGLFSAVQEEDMPGPSIIAGPGDAKP